MAAPHWAHLRIIASYDNERYYIPSNSAAREEFIAKGLHLLQFFAAREEVFAAEVGQAIRLPGIVAAYRQRRNAANPSTRQKWIVESWFEVGQARW